MVIGKTKTGVDIIVIITRRSRRVWQSLECTYTLVLVVIHTLYIVLEVVVVTINVGLLHLLESLVRVEADHSLCLQTWHERVEMTRGSHGSIEVTTAVLLNTTSCYLGCTILAVGSSREEELTIRTIDRIDRKVLACTPCEEVPYVDTWLHDVVDTTTEVETYRQELVDVQIDIHTKVVAVQGLLTVVTAAVLGPLGVKQTFLTEVRETHVVASTIVTTAQLEIGAIHRSSITEHGVMPVGIEVLVLVHACQLLAIAHLTILFDVVIRELRAQAIEIASLVARQGVVV